MAWVKYNGGSAWVDDDGTGTVGTKFSAARMNNLEDGIEEAKQRSYNASVLVATTAALPSHTRSGSVLTASANGVLSVDGTSLATFTGYRVLVKNEGAGTHLENGIYTVTQPGDASHPWILTRATDADASTEILSGSLVQTSGASNLVNSDRTFVLSTPDPIIVNSTALTFTELVTQPRIAMFTSLPSSPVTGQVICFYITSSVKWMLRFNGTKWDFLGGGALLAEVTANESTASTSYTALTTAGPSIAVPVAGDYIVEIGCRLGGTGVQLMSYDIGGTGAVDADAIRSDTASVIEAVRARPKTLTAVTLTAKYRSGSTTASYLDRWMKLTPVGNLG